MNGRLAAIPVLAAVLFGLVACNSSTTGAANPTQGGQQTTTTSGGGQTSASGTTGAGGSGTASLQPCDLLSSSVRTQYQLAPAGSTNTGDVRSCSWSKQVDANGKNGYAVGVDIRPSQGLKDAVDAGYTVTSDQVGSHQGKQLQSTNSADCIVLIGVTASSRVDVSVNADTATQACQVANNLAKAVEPQLPAGS